MLGLFEAAHRLLFVLQLCKADSPPLNNRRHLHLLVVDPSSLARSIFLETCHRHFIYPHASFDETYHVKSIFLLCSPHGKQKPSKTVRMTNKMRKIPQHPGWEDENKFEFMQGCALIRITQARVRVRLMFVNKKRSTRRRGELCVSLIFISFHYITSSAIIRLCISEACSPPHPAEWRHLS